MSTREQQERIELLQGTLDLLILRTPKLGPMHGHAIAKAIEFRSNEVLQVEQGSLYPALHRMEEAGWIKAEWVKKDTGRRARVYEVTAEGKKQLAAEQQRWEDVSSAVNRILRTV